MSSLRRLGRLFGGTIVTLGVFVACSTSSSTNPSDAGAGDGATGEAGVTDAPSGQNFDSAECSFVGTWTGTYNCATGLSGESLSWVIAQDGTATENITSTADVTIPTLQTWKIVDTTLTIKDLDSDCMDIEGTYTIAFDQTCNNAGLKRLNDKCPGRGDCTDGLQIKRQAQ